jgi:tRNA threonylcarbamoyladenosine biosynthesis protein TsaB
MSVAIAIDSSTPITAVGIQLADGSSCELFDVPAVGERPRHATAALPQLESLLADAGRTWADVSRVVVGIGPGGFTGIRVGIATALGLARGCDADLLGVSGIAALLARCAGDRSSFAFIDARRNELFMAQGGQTESVSCVARELAGTGLPPGSVCVGDGAVLERNRLTALGLSVPAAESNLHKISPLALIELAEAGFGSPALEPVYVRNADAVPIAERGRN